MSLKDYETLRLLEDALKSVKSELSRIKTKEGKILNLSKALRLVQEAAKKSTSSAEKALINEFKVYLEKINQRAADEQVTKQLTRIYLHFNAEVFMAEASYGYSDEDYNLFLALFEQKQVINYILELYMKEEKWGLDSASASILKKLDLITIENKKMRLTEKGLSLAKALESLQLLKMLPP